MPSSRALRRLVLAAVLASALGACSSAEPEPGPDELASSEAEQRFTGCDALAADVTEALQGYVEAFSPDGTELSTTGPSPEVLASELETFQRRRALLGCSPREMAVLLEDRLADLRGDGPMAAAVAAAVRAQVLADAGPAETVTVAGGDDLAAAVHGAGTGALVRLAPGRHELEQPLVVLRDITIVGAEDGTSSIVSGAGGGVLVQLSGSLEVHDVRVEHEGELPASVLIASGGELALHAVTVAGGVADDAGTVGWGLVIAAGPGSGASPGVVADDLTARGNAAGGVALAGRAGVLRDIVAEDNGGCGLCYLGGGSGTVQGGRLGGNGSGVSATQDGTAFITGVTIAGNTAAGVLVEGDAVVELADLLVSGNGAVGLAATGDASLRAWDVTVSGHGDAGAIVERSATLTLGSTILRAAKVGLYVRGEAEGRVATTRIEDVSEAHAVYGEDATGSISATCDEEPFGVVLLERADVRVDGDGCELTDQRE